MHDIAITCQQTLNIGNSTPHPTTECHLNNGLFNPAQWIYRASCAGPEAARINQIGLRIKSGF